MKDITESFDRVRGLFNITVTVFDGDGDVDMAAMTTNIERVLDLGYDGVLIGGIYGEFPTMSPEERAGLFRHAMDVVGGRAPVLLCSAHSDPRIVRDLTGLASDLGGLPMVTPPYGSEVTDAHIIDFFKDIAAGSRTGVMIYNAPGIGVTLSPEIIEDLADIPNVVALKQGDLDPSTVDRIASSCVGRIRVLAASDLVFLGPLAAGFDGFSSTNSCALPELILNSYRHITQGDATKAGELHRLWYPFRALARAFGQPQVTKAAMDMRGWKGGNMRFPLRNLSAREWQAVRAALVELSRHSAAGITDLPGP